MLHIKSLESDPPSATPSHSRNFLVLEDAGPAQNHISSSSFVRTPSSNEKCVTAEERAAASARLLDDAAKTQLVPNDLGNLMRKMMAFDPDDRWSVKLALAHPVWRNLLAAQHAWEGTGGQQHLVFNLRLQPETQMG